MFYVEAIQIKELLSLDGHIYTGFCSLLPSRDLCLSVRLTVRTMTENWQVKAEIATVIHVL